MYKRLPKSEKIVHIQRYLSGEKASIICKDAKVSRTIFYRWLKTYRYNLSLKKKDIFASKIVRGKSHWKSLNRKQQEEIIKIALKNPASSPQKIASIINVMDSRLRGNEGGGYVSAHGVWNVLRRNGLNTRRDRDLYISKYGRSSIKKAVYSDKLNMIARHERGERVKNICNEYAVSRTIFYKWLKRYRQSQSDEAALNDMRPKGESHWRYVDGVTDTVLGIVATNPEYSINRLTNELRANGREKVVGRHGIYNILKRFDLNTYEKRLKYASSKAPVEVLKPQIAQVLLPPQPRYSFLSFLSPPFSKWIPAFAGMTRRTSFGVTASLCLIVILIPIVLLSSFLPADSFVQRIAYFIAFISLLCGLFFFLYSLKYYLSIAYVLSFSRREETALSKLRGIGGFLAGVFGVSISVEKENQESRQFGGQARIKNQGGLPEQSPAFTGGKESVGLQVDLSHVVLERNPFVSVHVSTYNEKRVIDRLLTACTSFDYPNYEVVVADDSNDETVGLIEKWEHNPRVKISHRASRDGYKGGALAQALRVTDRRAEFVLVFDADFIPYPDTIVQFLKYFQLSAGSLDFSRWSLDSKEQKVMQQERLTTRDQRLTTNPIAAVQGYQWLSSAEATAGRHVSSGSNIAAVQGYQWHVLNKSENWITRGVRSEYAGSYVIERSGAELYSGLKQISGSVYMIRRDVLQGIGWGTSLTEDFELTLKLYEAGYKVVYTPYIQAPAEAVSTIKRLIRQRMRWAEGHSFNIKRMLIRLLFGHWEGVAVEGQESSQKGTSFSEASRIKNPANSAGRQELRKEWNKKRIWKPSPLTRSEKMELVYLAPYYLQAALFILGTTCWFIAEVIFQVRLPFWTEVWGWSLVATNLFSLPLMNMIGMFMEEAEEKDYLGIISFVALSYIVAPFQAYAAVKGFLEKEEGPWFRTPKTGRITDTLMPGRIARFVRGIFGRHSPAEYKKSIKPIEIGNPNAYFALATANNQFGSFKIRRKNIRWAGNLSVVGLLMISTLLANIANTMSFSESAYAAKPYMKTVNDNKESLDNQKQVDLGISSEETLKKEPKNKDTIIKNALSKEISGYRSIAKKTHSGEQVEFIFHESPNVRVKLGHREIEFKTDYIGGQKVNPKSAKIFDNKEVVYEEVIKDVDLKYTINGDLITEEFILKNQAAAKAVGSKVEQAVRTVDVKVISPHDGAFGFYTDDGQEIFKLSRPFLKDAENKVSNDVSLTLKKTSIGHKLIKTLETSAQKWLQEPNRAYPVSLDPSVIVSSGVTDAEIDYGGLQRKVVYMSGAVTPAWYAISDDGSNVPYYRSTDGTTWSSPTNLSSGSNNHNSTLSVSGNFIVVAWVSDDIPANQDAIGFRRIDTTTSFPHTLTSICGVLTGFDSMTSTYMVSIAALSSTEVIAAFSDTGAGATVDVVDVTNVSTCVSNDVHPGNVPFGTQGAGLTAGDRPVLVGLTSTTAALVFQDGDLSFSYFDATLDEWQKNNQTIVADNDTVYSVTTDGTTIWVLMQNGTASADLFSLNNTSADLVETQIDADAGANGDDNDSDIDMFCPAEDNCKIVYTDNIDADPDLVFRDCDDADCSTGTSTVMDSDIGAANDQAGASVYCVTDGTNCKVVYGDEMDSAVSPLLAGVDCNDEACAGDVTACTLIATTNCIDADLGAATAVLHTSLYCPSDTDCKVLYNDFALADMFFADCSHAACNTRDVVTAIDTNAGSTAQGDLTCSAGATDCKFVYHDNSATGGCADANALCFVDCGASTCATASAVFTNIDSDIGTTTGAAVVAIDCPAATDCKVAYGDTTAGDLFFVDCADATCSGTAGTCTSGSRVCTQIDATGGATTNTLFKVDMDCPSATDCKIIYVGEVTGGTEDTYFVDCDSAACTTGSAYEIPILGTGGAAGPRFGGAIQCLTSTNCKMAYYDGASGTAPTVQFADCDTEDCLLGWTNAADPWSAETTLETVAITYDSTNSDLYASSIKDATNKAYWKMSDASSISWGAENDYGWSAGDMTNISAPEKAAGNTQIGVVLRRASGSTYEFAPVPEYSLMLLAILPLLPKLLKRLRRRRELISAYKQNGIFKKLRWVGG